MATKKKATAKKKAAHRTKSAGETQAEERFTRDLLVRGEAACPDDQGRLPSEATHEIVKGSEKEGKLPKVKRRLFKMY
ncbi:MAG TPA: hypothetical protein VEU30_14230 [Thermoanaerobaculia bacterium]|nr:hypothetical protein [Thermoanaerobaculia bacterium]